MANENVPAPAPTRSDDQIIPVAAWVPIGKSNYVLDLQKKQNNPIFQISVDILQNTNFFKAFTASASILAIYIQQFWNTLTYEAKSGVYSFELDETRFVLDANLLREALETTPIDQAHQFVSPLSGEAIMDFVNELGYTKDRPRYPVLQMLWGIITSSNVDYAELMWEEFVQTIQTFLTDKANLSNPIKKDRKDKAHVIPYCRFTELIICHLRRTNNIHQRSTSPFHLAEDDLRLGNLKFVPKGEEEEVFRMPIPNELISNNIRNASYYNAYLEMVTKHDQKVAAQKEGKKKSASTKQPKPKPAIEKSSKPAPAPKPKVTKEKPSKASTAKPPKPKPAKEKSTKATPLQQAGKGKVTKVRTMKSTFQLVDKPDEEPAHSEPEPEPEHQGEGEEFDIEHAIQMSLESFQAQSQAHVGALNTPKRRSTTDLFILQRRTPTTEEASTGPSVQPLDDTSTNIVHDSPSPTDAETGARTDKIISRGDTETRLDQTLVKLTSLNLYQSRHRWRPGPRISRVALVGPDPEPTHDEFMVDLYTKVQESLKFSTGEHVILEDLLSSTGTHSSMKNLEDAYAIGDQFINDKSTKDEPGKLNVEAEVVSIVTVPIYQASSLVPSLSTPVIDLSPPKPASSTT
ncbi:hypothetical protein Tco_0083802 [Tanacetum coccineum]